ncbi:hypothetical protein N0V90_008764 [Kalmusia sp. IMI 367209]|nr:hypothetical protein N0V90_008764 [Kalmusia sp. IMI 367209]
MEAGNHPSEPPQTRLASIKLRRDNWKHRNIRSILTMKRRNYVRAAVFPCPLRAKVNKTVLRLRSPKAKHELDSLMRLAHTKYEKEAVEEMVDAIDIRSECEDQVFFEEKISGLHKLLTDPHRQRQTACIEDELAGGLRGVTIEDNVGESSSAVDAGITVDVEMADDFAHAKGTANVGEGDISTSERCTLQEDELDLALREIILLGSSPLSF